MLITRSVTTWEWARANQNRDYRIFEEYAYFLVNEARQKRKTDIFKLGVNSYFQLFKRNVKILASVADGVYQTHPIFKLVNNNSRNQAVIIL